MASSIAAAAAAAPAVAAAVSGLTTNGRVDPLGIPGDAPVFGWQNESSRRGVTQTAYELTVGTSVGASDVWTTGRVSSAQQVDIAYGGPALASGTRYFWQVRTWDDQGTASAWSAPAAFETGLLTAADWGPAAWVGKAAVSYANWTDYTASIDFTLNSIAFGTFLRAQDTNSAYMWQINVGTAANSVPSLVPHIKANGGFTVLAPVDLRSFGFTRDQLLTGTHNVTYTLTGNTIKTTLDGVDVDTRTVTNFAAGTVGVRTFGGESVTVSGLKVTKSDGTVLANPDFSRNPLTGGSLDGRKVTVSGSADSLYTSEVASEPLVRTGFQTTPGKTVASARVYASAHGVYELSMNGKKVGDQFLAPGYTEYAKRIQSQTYDVTSLVQSGNNAFGAALGEGWWAGKVGLAGKGQYGTNLSLIARLKITYTDGTTQWVDTNPDWKWSPGPFVATDNQIGETYDARLEQAGWNTATFDASAWNPVSVGPSDTAKLAPQPDAPVRQWNLLSTKAVTTPSPGVTVYDLGQNMVGIPRVTITGKAGETVKLRHAEVLKPDGTLYTENLRAALATDYYTFAADGTVTYQPTFTQHGFRYIEITGLAAIPAAADVKGVVLGSDIPDTGKLSTSDAMLNQLNSNIYWGARGNFLSIPTDTPARDERLGWTGDISIFAPTASYLSDMRGFLGKWMTDVRDEQYADGGVPAVVPSTNGAFGEKAIGWEDAIITVPHAVWEGYGDTKIVNDNYAAMKKFMDYARASAGADNLETGRLSFFTNDWLNLDDPSDQGVLGTAIWAQDVKMMSEMAAAVGKTADATEYAALYQAIRQSFTAAYVAADGTVRGNSQTGYALALGMGLITDQTLVPKVGQKFVAKLAEADNHLRTGFIGTPWLLPALTTIDRDDVAYALLLKKDYPSWGYEISKGATTVWERWNSIQPDGSFGPVDMNSFNHYAYGAVADWMHQNIGGIQLDGPGYSRSIIEPHPGGGLTEADGSVDTVYGTLSSSWDKTATGLTLDVTVPVNTTSKVRIPSDSAAKVTQGGASLTVGNGITDITYDPAERVTQVTVGSGVYSFQAAPVTPKPVDPTDPTTPTAPITVPPTEPVSDYVDFGDQASETAHAVTASPTSGTNSEAGFTRRYANNSTPGAYYTADVTVPAGEAFRLRMRETWNTPGIKDYDVYVNDVLVKHVNTVLPNGAANRTTNYEILVDQPALIANNGKVTVKFQYPTTNGVRQYYDPSIADMWAVVSPDTTAPTVTAVVDPAAPSGLNGWYTGAATLNLTTADNRVGSTTEYRIGDGAWTAYTAPVAVAEGTTTVEYRATDKAGNVSTVGTVTVKRDVTVPTAAGALNGRAVTATATDAGSGITTVEYQVDGGAWTAYTAPVTVDNAAHTVVLRSTDNAGLVSATATVAVPAVVVTDKATVTVTSNATPTADGWYNQAALVTLQVPTGAKAQYRINGGNWNTYSRAFTIATTGSNTVETRLLRSNVVVAGSGTSTSVKVDTKLPVSTATRAPVTTTGTPRNPITLTITATDVGAGPARSEYQVNGGTWTTSTGPIVFASVGTQLVSYRSVDAAGNTEQARTLTLTIKADPATTVKAGTTKIAAGGFVTLTLAGFQRYDSVTVTLGNTTLGTVGTDINGSARTTMQIPRSLGAGTYRITAAGSTGQPTASVTISVTR